MQVITENYAKTSLPILTKMSKVQLQRAFLCGNLSVQPFGPCEDFYTVVYKSFFEGFFVVWILGFCLFL